MADKQISQLVAATTINNDDLFVMQQGGTAKKLSGQKLADFVYQSAADQIERVDEAVEQAQAAVDSLEEQKNEIAQTIADMAELGTDTTLSTPGMAADAAATGEVKDIALARFEQSEITGVPIAIFEDGADDVPVKALKVAIDPVQDLHGYDNPWPAGGGKNLEPLTLNGDTTSITDKGITMSINSDGSYKFTGTATQDGGRFALRSKEFTLAAGTYISSRQAGSSGNYPTWLLHKSSDNSIIKGTLGAFTLSEETSVYVGFNVTNGTTYNVNYYPQIESGSTATSWVPYENICPITGWTGADIVQYDSYNIFDGVLEVGGLSTSNGGNIDQSDRQRSKNYFPVKSNTTYYSLIGSAISRTIFFYDANKVYISNLNLGTALGAEFVTPINCEYIRFIVITTNAINLCINVSDTLKNGSFYPYGHSTIYPITFPNEAGTVYGGTLDVTNGVLTVMNFGIENLGALTWQVYSSTNNTFRARFLSGYPHGITKAAQTYNKCSCYRPVGNGAGNLVDKSIRRDGSWSSEWVYIRDTSFTDANELQTSLANQQFIYELATPITYALTPPVVRTLLALNNIWADTGNILDLIYRKMPIPAEELENTLESMIAGVEATMEATQNYTAGDLVVAAHKLYHIDTNIASGETLDLVTNCHITTIANELAALSSAVSTGFASLGNLANLTYEVVT